MCTNDDHCQGSCGKIICIWPQCLTNRLTQNHEATHKLDSGPSKDQQENVTKENEKSTIYLARLTLFLQESSGLTKQPKKSSKFVNCHILKGSVTCESGYKKKNINNVYNFDIKFFPYFSKSSY